MERATAEIGNADLAASPMVGVEESDISEERKVVPSGEAASAAAAVDEEEDSSSVEESSEEGSSSDDDDDDDDVDGANDDQSNSGLSEYELLRLKRIERNKARLAELGLAGGSIAKKSGHGKKRAKKKERVEEDLVATRSQPKRAKKSALTQEQLHGPSIARYKRKDDRPRAPKAPKKEKYVPGTCYGCKKEDDEERIYCAYCRYQWHPDCHEPKIVLPLAEGTLFRCNNCEGKPKRLACGFCEPCNRTEDCGGCTYCVVSGQSETRSQNDTYLVVFVILSAREEHRCTLPSPTTSPFNSLSNVLSYNSIVGKNTNWCQEEEVHISPMSGDV